MTTTRKIETPVSAATAASATAAGTQAAQRSLTGTTGTKFIKLFFVEIQATTVVFIIGKFFMLAGDIMSLKADKDF